MVYIPQGTVTPPDDAPVVFPYPGLDMLRRQTHWFIEDDPTDIILVPQIRTQAPGGGFNMSDGAPRAVQTFKLIYQSGSDGVVQTTDGQNMRYDFILLGEWDATVQQGDVWAEPENENQKYVVQGLLPYNGYEVKAAVVSFGKKAQHG